MKYREPRKPLETTTKLHTQNGVFQAVLRSISASGAKVQGMAPLPLGTRVRIELIAGARDAKVVWCRGKSIGLKFGKPLSAPELAAVHKPGSVSRVDMNRAATKGFGHGFREL